MADSGAIDAALVAKLINDASLMSFAVDGVFFGVASKNATSFVIIDLLVALDTDMQRGRAFESPIYLVKAVTLSTTGANVRTAAARIDALLDQGTLTITGYGRPSIRRVERVRYVERHDEDNDARWQHWGGQYQVMVSPQG